eukprot:3785806-Rhodomonas_salina.1
MGKQISTCENSPVRSRLAHCVACRGIYWSALGEQCLAFTCVSGLGGARTDCRRRTAASEQYSHGKEWRGECT